MAKLHTLFIFLALLSYHGSLLAHARKINIKPWNQHSQPNTKTVANINVPFAEYEEARKLEDAGAGNTNAFRPTTPGGSPGVGHQIITSKDNNMKSLFAVQSPDAKVSVTQDSKDDFKPTDPGHSPGVGHDDKNKIGQ
ncbi:precursor of CEP9-like [Vigna unguiculata]|uniref:precursor of CEP9-like n=1 Tax=Vigna unguiculata TaxID=3917 RepID=UPI0010166E36|nr:precursor of CEP9-like [Vigna unguiculata]